MGRLAALALPGGTTATYAYDSWGDRVSKTVTAGGIATTTGYYRDATQAYEFDGAGELQAVTGFADDGNTPEWRMTATGGVFLYHTDHLGTPILLTDLTGAIVWSATIEPFGTAHVEPGSADQPWRFPGQYYDAESGLHYNRQRYYDPQTGRYLNPDPIGQAEGGNTLRYAQSSTVAVSDATGLNPAAICLAFPGLCVTAADLAAAAAAVAWATLTMLLEGDDGCSEDEPPFGSRPGRDCDAMYAGLISWCQSTTSSPKARNLCYAWAGDEYADCLAGR